MYDDDDDDDDDDDEPLKLIRIRPKKLVENLFLYSNIHVSSKHKDSLIRWK